MDTHTTEYRKSLNEILIVLCKALHLLTKKKYLNLAFFLLMCAFFRIFEIAVILYQIVEFIN